MILYCTSSVLSCSCAAYSFPESQFQALLVNLKKPLPLPLPQATLLNIRYEDVLEPNLGSRTTRNMRHPFNLRRRPHRVLEPDALSQESGLPDNDTFNEGVTEVGRNLLRHFPTEPPPSVPPVIKMSPQKANHVSMAHGAVQWDLGRRLEKGDTGAGFGDDFCMVHGITRVFVLDPQNHVIAMVSPMRYMMYQAFKMYAKSPVQSDIFQFLKRAAAPRWAMRAAANQILTGQTGCITRQGNTVSITGSYLKDGQATLPEVVFERVPYDGISWIVMDKWLEEAKSHQVSFVVAPTGLNSLPEFDRARTLPLVIREDEADMLMAQTVKNLTCRDQRFERCSNVDQFTLALQFREGWYAPKSSGLTRIMRMLERSEDADAVADKSGEARWKVAAAYSREFDKTPSQDLWYIGGVDNVHADAMAKEIGTHLELTLDFESGGFQRRVTRG